MLLFSAQYSCYISSLTNRKWVSVPFSGTTSHSMTTGSEWQCLFLYPAFHPIPWPIVCELQYPILPSTPTPPHPMTNSMWVMVPFLCATVSSHLIPWPIACKCALHSAPVSSHFIFNREWVTVYSSFLPSSLITLQTVCKWHCLLCGQQSHLISSHAHQHVSDSAFCFAQQSHLICDPQRVSDSHPFPPSSHITSHLLIHSKWVTMFFFSS